MTQANNLRRSRKDMSCADEFINEATENDFQLSKFTPYRTAVVAQLLSESLAREYRDRFGISIPDWRVLVHLAAEDGASVRDIEQKVVMEKSKVSRAATRLVERGLLARNKNENDGRLVHLSLTKTGKDLMEELLPLATAFQQRIEAVLGADFENFERSLSFLWNEFSSARDVE